MDTKDAISRRLSLAVEAARLAGEITLRYFLQSNFTVEWKGDKTPVTVADREAETFLRQRISEVFPEDAILGEEFPARDGTSGFRWILDPIDGTKSFVHGVPLYGTLVAVEYDGQSVVGVIRIPATGECVYAMQGGGAFYTLHENTAVKACVSTCDTLSDALVMTTSEKTLHTTGRYPAWRRLTEACRLARHWGDCYGYMLVATGRAEVMLDPVVNLWDVAALYPVITEAGGAFTDWQGNPTYTASQCVASNGRLHAKVMRKLHGE